VLIGFGVGISEGQVFEDFPCNCGMTAVLENLDQGQPIAVGFVEKLVNFTNIPFMLGCQHLHVLVHQHEEGFFSITGVAHLLLFDVFLRTLESLVFGALEHF